MHGLARERNRQTDREAEGAHAPVGVFTLQCHLLDAVGHVCSGLGCFRLGLGVKP